MNVDLETLAPYLEQLGFGGVAGFAAGFALKKIGKLMAVAVGLLFIALQLLAYYGFLTINWVEIQGRVEPLFAADSLREAWQALLHLLTYNLPFAAAFVPGFLIGVRRG